MASNSSVALARELIELARDNNLREIECETEGVRLKIVFNGQPTYPRAATEKDTDPPDFNLTKADWYGHSGFEPTFEIE